MALQRMTMRIGIWTVIALLAAIPVGISSKALKMTPAEVRAYTSDRTSRKPVQKPNVTPTRRWPLYSVTIRCQSSRYRADRHVPQVVLLDCP